MTRKFYDDPFTLLHLDTSSVRPTDIYVEDVLNLDGTELTPDFDARLDNELVKVTAVVLDGGGAGVDKWTIAHLGGAAASIHKAGSQVDVVLTANGLTIGLLDYFVGAPASPTEGDILYYHSGAWSKLAIGANTAVLTSNGTDPSWVIPTDDDSAYETSSHASSTYMPLAGGTFTGDVEFEAQIVDDTEASGSDGDVLTKVSGHPRWAASAAGTTLAGLTDVDVSVGLDDGDVLTYNSGAGKWKNVDPSGGSGVSHTCKAYRHAAFTTTSGAYAIFPFDSTEWDDSGDFDTTNHYYVAPSAGIYDVESFLYTTANDHVAMQVYVYTGGVWGQVALGPVYSGSSVFGTGWGISTKVKIANANDRIAIYYLTNANDAMSIQDKYQNWVTIAKIA